MDSNRLHPPSTPSVDLKHDSRFVDCLCTDDRRRGRELGMTDIYEVRVQGHLEDHWSEWLGGLAVQRRADGTTVLVGPVVDQAALHGVISRIRDLGVPRLSERRPAPDINEGVDDEHE